MIRALFVAMAFLSVSAMAQTGPCFAGIQDPPVFALVTSNPVRLSFKSTTRFPLSTPLLSKDGNAFTVDQYAPDFVVAFSLCNNQSVSLGDLAPGSYTVKWQYREDLGSAVFASFTFAFTIPAESPCIAGTGIQPQSPAAGQPVSILYSSTFRGFLQTPEVAMDGNLITIDQSAVIADPAFSGHVPCARGIVQLGGLQPGYYPVTVHSNSGAPMFDAFAVPQPPRRRAVH